MAQIIGAARTGHKNSYKAIGLGLAGDETFKSTQNLEGQFTNSKPGENNATHSFSVNNDQSVFETSQFMLHMSPAFTGGAKGAKITQEQLELNLTEELKEDNEDPG